MASSSRGEPAPGTTAPPARGGGGGGRGSPRAPAASPTPRTRRRGSGRRRGGRRAFPRRSSCRSPQSEGRELMSPSRSTGTVGIRVRNIPEPSIRIAGACPTAEATPYSIAWERARSVLTRSWASSVAAAWGRPLRPAHRHRGATRGQAPRGRPDLDGARALPPRGRGARPRRRRGRRPDPRRGRQRAPRSGSPWTSCPAARSGRGSRRGAAHRGATRRGSRPPRPHARPLPRRGPRPPGREARERPLRRAGRARTSPTSAASATSDAAA